MNAKTQSKQAIVFASMWIIVHVIAKAVFPLWGKEYGLSVGEIVASGVTLVIIWTPVYRSIWLDKKFGIKSDDASAERKEKQCGEKV